jgi:hypothetical protein
MTQPLPVLPNVPLGFEDDKPPTAKELAQRHTDTAIQVLVRNASQVDDLAASNKAAMTLLDRGWGRVEQTIDHSGEVVVRVDWASADRLSYRFKTPQQADAPVIDVVPITAPAQLTEPETPQSPWKQEPDSPAKAMRELDRGGVPIPPPSPSEPSH